MTKRRFAVVGTGTRATYSWVAPMVKEFADVVELVETDLTPPPMEGSHGGADSQLQNMIFRPTGEADPLGRRAVLEEGIQAVLIGIAANRSIALGGRPVDIQTSEPV